MEREVWGPAVWHLFHTMGYSYRPNFQNKYSELIKNTMVLLPCEMCVEHFTEMMHHFPPEKYYGDREVMIKWMNQIHNRVNRRLGKPIIGIEQMDRIYHPGGGELVVNHSKIITYIKMVEMYFTKNMTSVGFNHLRGTVFNLCYIFPCVKCRELLITYADNNRLTIRTAKTWLNGMEKIVRADIPPPNPKVIIRRRKLVKKNIVAPRLAPAISQKGGGSNNTKGNNDINLSEINGKTKVVIKKINPPTATEIGMRKIFTVLPNTQYKINIQIENPNKLNVITIITNLNNNIHTRYDDLFTGDKTDMDKNIFYFSNDTEKLAISMLVKYPKVNDTFYIDKMDLEPVVITI